MHDLHGHTHTHTYIYIYIYNCFFSDEQTRAKIRHDLMMIPVQKQTVINPEENEFWETLRKACLVPDTGFGREEELKGERINYRIF